MTRTRLDVAVGALVAAILVLGVGITWQTYRQAQAHGEMMDHGMAFHGPHPFWYLLGTLLLAAVVAGAYAVVRDDLVSTRSGPERSGTVEPAAGSGPSDPATDDAPEPKPGVDSGTTASPRSNAGSQGVSGRPDVLGVLPEDERRILEPVVEEPGITQIALRDRSEFSKSKVSQTVTDLEKRGLLYRERQGRTYRVYPSDELGAQ